MSGPPADIGPATRAVLDQGIDPLTPNSLPASLLATVAQLRPGALLRMPPLQWEARAMWEYGRLRRDPVWRTSFAGAGQPVALVPGFLAGDASLRPLADWLRRSGCWTSRAGIRVNVACSTELIDRMERRVERLAERAGRRVTIIGQSRGGVLARGLAVRRPDLLAGIVTLGSPHRDPFAIHPLVLLQVAAVGTLGSFGVPGLFGETCWSGACCERFRRESSAAFPPEVRFVSVYSRSDGVVDWRSCLAPGAEHVEIRGTHFGMAVNPAAYRIIAQTLADGQDADARRAASAA